jgi:sugar lactone lactonase YvrE
VHLDKCIEHIGLYRDLGHTFVLSKLITMKKIICIVSLITCHLSLVYGQIISTVVGAAPPSNITATSFGMQINGEVADKHGNLYVSDDNWSIVRKVNLSTGVATIVAGIGNYGSSGDGGQATAASLSYPGELGIDTSGNIYIAEGTYPVSRIRMVNVATGIITTVAGTGVSGYSGDGGQATAAKINWQPGISFDRINNMYIADWLSNRIRKVDANTHIITTIAGTGTAGYNGDNIAATAAQLNGPNLTCEDTSGNIYIADCFNNRIRRINTSGIITTVAGTGNYGYSGDGGQATASELRWPQDVKLDKTESNIYIADYNNNRVREISLTSGIITTVTGNGTYGHSGDGGAATLGEIGCPYNLSFDTAGNYYVVEGVDSAKGYWTWIRKISPGTGIISTMAGNGSAGYNGDGISATSATLALISPSSFLPFFPNGYPNGLTADASGNLYVSDFDDDRIRKINSAGIISTYAGSKSAYGFLTNVPADSGLMSGPEGIGFDKNNNLFIACMYNDRVLRVDANDSLFNFAGNGLNAPKQGAYFGDNGPATRAELFYPSGVAVDDSGNVFVADVMNMRIRKISWKNRDITTVVGTGNQGYRGDGGPAKSAWLALPLALALDDSDNIYIDDFGNNVIRKVTFATGKIYTVAGTRTAGFNGDGLAATNTQFNYPEGILLDANGDIYIADSQNQRIRKIDHSTHLVSTVAGDGTVGFSGDGGMATSASLNTPGTLASDGAGNMYISDIRNNRVRKVTNVLGVNEVKKSIAHAMVYPNPNNGIFTIQTSGISAELLVEIFNMLGEEVYSQNNIHNSTFNIDLSAKSSGVYMYRILTEAGSLISEGKIIKE